MRSVAEHSDERTARRRRALAFVVLMAIAALVASVFGRGHAPPRDPPRAVRSAVEQAAGGDAVEARPSDASSRTDAAPSETAVFLCTFADGEPVPSILWDLDAPIRGVLDWSAARPRHLGPVEETRLAVLARDCQIVFVSRSELPERGEHRVDMRRSPMLDVRLVNVPPTLRERLNVQLQMSYGQLPARENIASCLMQDRSPILMLDTDRALIPLALPLPGFVVVHAMSRQSTHSCGATPEIPFEPVSQVIEIDLAGLAAACNLVELSLTLRFPYEHPEGEMELRIENAAGTSKMSQRFRRERRREVQLVFRDVARASVHPLLQYAAGGILAALEPIDLTGGSRDVVRDVVAEGSLKVVLTGREGLAADDCSVLLRRQDGQSLVANWPRGNETRFEHLPAMTLYAQAIGYVGHRCSPIVRVEIGVAQAHEIALQLVPAGEVEIAAGALGADVRHLDVHYPGQAPSRVGLSTEHLTRFWLPLGDPRVEWSGSSRTLRVEAGVQNRWP